jgi:hypothetical protein
LAQESSHLLSDIDLAYLGTDSETEERLYDPLYEALQRLLGEGNFDNVAPVQVLYRRATPYAGHALARQSFPSI